MKKREFTAALNRICKGKGKQSRIDLAKIPILDDETRAAMVHYIVRQRLPIVEALIPDGFDWKWLHSCGYLYKSQGNLFMLVHTCEYVPPRAFKYA